MQYLYLYSYLYLGLPQPEPCYNKKKIYLCDGVLYWNASQGYPTSLDPLIM